MQEEMILHWILHPPSVLVVISVDKVLYVIDLINLELLVDKFVSEQSASVNWLKDELS